MKRSKLFSILSWGIFLALAAGRANALPGQTTDEVAAWIQAHPTLRPDSGEKLLVTKSDTPAQRFIFQASILAPGRVISLGNPALIRSERISLFDMINGVTQERLEESLRVIHGIDIYQDYQRAQVIYDYPTQVTIDEARNQNVPLLAALEGQLRAGDRYAYWVEIAQTREGYAYTGQINVFLKEDLDKLEVELRNR